VKFSFGTVKETLTDVQYNEEKVKKGLTQIKLHVDSTISETKNDLYKLSAKITTKSYVAQVVEALGTLRRNLDVLLDNILKAKKGVL